MYNVCHCSRTASTPSLITPAPSEVCKDSKERRGEASPEKFQSAGSLNRTQPSQSKETMVMTERFVCWQEEQEGSWGGEDGRGLKCFIVVLRSAPAGTLSSWNNEPVHPLVLYTAPRRGYQVPLLLVKSSRNHSVLPQDVPTIYGRTHRKCTRPARRCACIQDSAGRVS